MNLTYCVGIYVTHLSRYEAIYGGRFVEGMMFLAVVLPGRRRGLITSRR